MSSCSLESDVELGAGAVMGDGSTNGDGSNEPPSCGL